MSKRRRIAHDNGARQANTTPTHTNASNTRTAHTLTADSVTQPTQHIKRRRIYLPPHSKLAAKFPHLVVNVENDTTGQDATAHPTLGQQQQQPSVADNQHTPGDTPCSCGSGGYVQVSSDPLGEAAPPFAPPTLQR